MYLWSLCGSEIWLHTFQRLWWSSLNSLCSYCVSISQGLTMWFTKPLVSKYILVEEREHGSWAKNRKCWGQEELLELMIKLVCSQCQRNGLVSKPDQALKYSSHKQTHLNTHPSHSLPLSFSLQLDQRQEGFTDQVSPEEEMGHSATFALCQILSSTIQHE